MRIAVTGSGSLQDGADKIAPSIGALFSDTFANDTVGILVDAIYTRHDTQTNRVYVSGWPRGYYAPCQMTPSCTDAELADKSNPGLFETQTTRKSTRLNSSHQCASRTP